MLSGKVDEVACVDSVSARDHFLSCNKLELPFFPIFGGVPTFARDISKNDCTCYASVMDEKSSSGGSTIKNMSLFANILYLFK